MRESFTVDTNGRGFTDITSRVNDIVRKSGASDALCTVFVHHTSASLIVNENADPTVRRDLEAFGVRNKLVLGESAIVEVTRQLFEHRDEPWLLTDGTPADLDDGTTATMPVFFGANGGGSTNTGGGTNTSTGGGRSLSGAANTGGVTGAATGAAAGATGGSGASLPFTGSNIAVLVLWAVLLLGTGTVLVMAARRGTSVLEPLRAASSRLRRPTSPRGTRTRSRARPSTAPRRTAPAAARRPPGTTTAS